MINTTSSSVQSNDLPKGLERIFNLQKANQQKVANTGCRQRKAKLEKLRQVILKNREQIREALYKDFRKPASEVDIIETYKTISDIKYAIAHLSGWMAPHKVGTPMSQIGTRSYIYYEPKGVVLIVSPWNFPINLTLGPLVSAIAAGNCIMIKPSEHTPYSSALMKKMIGELFDESEVALIEGDVTVATEILKLPFNHIFFTGSPETGKVVMKAAAENLASVTLELGGKSPAIVDASADLKIAARRIAVGKWLNNGQLCIAPDYVLVHESIAHEFLEELKKTLVAFYGEDSSISGSYNRIVNQHHFQRIEGYFKDAISKGAEVAFGGNANRVDNFFSPTIMTNISANSDLWQKEIFGPILPFVTYTNLQQPIDWINGKEKPLAMYIFSNNKRNTDHIIRNTRAGATCINHAGLHFFNENLPFGGVNHSGIGKANGFFGFQAFSNARAVLRQWARVNGADALMPPYTSKKQRMVDMMMKWL